MSTDLVALLEGQGWILKSALFNRSSYGEIERFNAEVKRLQTAKKVHVVFGKFGAEIALAGTPRPNLESSADARAPQAQAGTGPAPIGPSGSSLPPPPTVERPKSQLQPFIPPAVPAPAPVAGDAELRRYKAARDAALVHLQRFDFCTGHFLLEQIGCAQDVFETVMRELVESGRVEWRQAATIGGIFGLSGRKVSIPSAPAVAHTYTASESARSVAVHVQGEGLPEHAADSISDAVRAAASSVVSESTPPQATPAEEPSVKVQEHETEQVPSDQIREFILSLLRTSGPMTTSEISHAIGRKPADGVAAYWMTKLRKENAVAKSGGRQSPWVLKEGKSRRKAADDPAPKKKAKQQLGKTKLGPKRKGPKYRLQMPVASVDAKLDFNEKRAEKDAAARAGVLGQPDFECALSNLGALKLDAPECKGKLSAAHTRVLFDYLDSIMGAATDRARERLQASLR